MKEFIKILDDRVRISTIKRYKELGIDKISIYFSTSKYGEENVAYLFGSTNERDRVISELDNILL